MKKGYVITIVCLLLALCVLGGLIYFDLFHGKDDAAQVPVDIDRFQEAVQEIADSRTIGGHLWILKEGDLSPTLFRFEHSPTFTAEILKENKAACLYATYETDTISITGCYDLYYEDGWRVELIDGKPVMIVEEATYHYENMDAVEVVFSAADENINPTAEQLDAVKTVIEKRLVANDITDYEASVDTANGQVVVSFPLANATEISAQFVENLSKTGMLQFYEGEGTIDATTGYEVPPAKSKLVLDGNDIKSATAAVNQDPSTSAVSPYVITLKLNEYGAAKFSAATQKLAGTRGVISIWLDFGEIWAKENNQPRYTKLSAPTVESHITGGEAVITGFAAYEDAKEVADLITSGALPFEITDRSVNIYD